MRDVIAGRVERVSDRSRQLLSVAAVIGRAFDFAWLQRASGLTEHDAAEGVEELVRRRLLHTVSDGFDFTHDRIREVVYGGLLPPRRTLLHRDVATALDALTAGPSIAPRPRWARTTSRRRSGTKRSSISGRPGARRPRDQRIRTPGPASSRRSASSTVDSPTTTRSVSAPVEPVAGSAACREPLPTKFS